MCESSFKGCGLYWGLLCSGEDARSEAARFPWEQLRLMGVPRAVRKLPRRERIQLGAVGLVLGFFLLLICSLQRWGDWRAENHTHCQAEARVRFVVTQETKGLFRLRASLEENLARRELAWSSLFATISTPYQNTYILTSNLCMHRFEIVSLICINWKLTLNLRTLKLFGIFLRFWPAWGSQNCMGLEQPGILEVVPVHGRRLDWMAF